MRISAYWSPGEKEVAEAYFDTLSELKHNSKHMINTLSKLADDNSRGYPHIIVHVIEERIRDVSKEFLCVVMLRTCVLSFLTSPLQNFS